MLLKPSEVFELRERRRMAEPKAGSRPYRNAERSYSEESVTPEIAFTSSAVISIITIMSQDLASVPLIEYQRRGRNKIRAYNHPYYRLMHEQPNPEMSSVTFRELIISHKLGWGNFYAQKIWDGHGVVEELWPLRPDRMRVERVDGEKVYIYTPASGGKPLVFFQDEILHIPGFGFDGLVGQSRISLARNAIGAAISMEKFGSKFFSNDAHVGMVYTHPGELSDKAYERLSEDLTDRAGVEKSHRPIILEEGMSIEKIGIPPDDAQFLESRKFQLAEINRIIGPVPPHLIGDMDKSTSWGTGIDSQEQGYINHSLLPPARRIEQALNAQLLLQADRNDGYFFEHLFDGLLRGDIQTRYQAYTAAITNGFMSRNEVRERENMNPRNGLDEMLMPLNMTPTGSTSSGGETQANALASLFREAVNRVVKREAQDVRGAVRRHLAKGQLDEWHAWLDRFYNVDHPAFVHKQFEALCEAQSRIYGSDTVQVNDYFLEYVAAHRAEAEAGNADELESLIDNRMVNEPERMYTTIMKLLEVRHEQDSQ